MSPPRPGPLQFVLRGDCEEGPPRSSSRNPDGWRRQSYIGPDGLGACYSVATLNECRRFWREPRSPYRCPHGVVDLGFRSRYCGTGGVCGPEPGHETDPKHRACDTICWEDPVKIRFPFWCATSYAVTRQGHMREEAEAHGWSQPP